MKRLLVLLFFLIRLSSVFADTYVNGYYKKDGTYVNGYTRSSPDSTNINNYSTQGNTNPYTGSQGTKAQDYSTEAQSYGSGRTIYTGPKGGQYYINENGNKVYVPKQ
jgi:hypothetical protein